MFFTAKMLAVGVLVLLWLWPGEAVPQADGETQIWFQHDDFVEVNGDGEPEFVPDMLARWYNHGTWSRALDNMAVYSLHENLFKTGGAPNGMGEKFLRLLRDHFGDKPADELHTAYLKLILPVLHAHSVALQIHTVGSKGDFVPWEMYGTTNGQDTIVYPRNPKGLELVQRTLRLVNGVCDSLFDDGYRVSSIKLQSVLSGLWQRGLQNNVYCALEYMKAVQAEYPEIKFYLGDALLQRRDHDKQKGWREAYETLYQTMRHDQKGYAHLNFEGLRLEFDKNWQDSLQFENARGWHELADAGAFAMIRSFGWKAGLEHNHPHAADEWEYEKVVLRTAAKSRALNLHWDFAVLHSDEAGGSGRAYPYDVAPENRGPNEPPTFASVLNKLFDFYNTVTSVGSLAYPAGFRMFQNYPNPFNPNTVIRFQLPVSSHVTLKVYDVSGREVAALVDGKLAAGEHAIVFDAAHLPSGVYFIRLTAGQFTQIRKAALIK
ncbi:MAG: T9SS type A sorting domain-containing protein [candidate division KSB1 bacterium]|nr:T9SS type A sorting domain-containing protein [candidate division KSB1 bacterium]